MRTQGGRYFIYRPPQVVCRPPLRGGACAVRLAHRRRVLAASFLPLPGVGPHARRMPARHSDSSTRQRPPSARSPMAFRGAACRRRPTIWFRRREEHDKQTCVLGQPIEKQFQVLEAVPLEEDAWRASSRGVVRVVLLLRAIVPANMHALPLSWTTPCPWRRETAIAGFVGLSSSATAMCLSPAAPTWPRGMGTKKMEPGGVRSLMRIGD